MVSVEFEGDYPPLRKNTGSEQSKKSVLRGVRVPVFWLGTRRSSDGDSFSGFPCDGEKQSLLDSLVLAQWEDRALKGLLRYDVTSCEMKVIDGKKNLVALLNENWNVNTFKECGNKIQRSGCLKLDYVKADIEDLLFCVAIGDKEGPVLIPSAAVPKDGVFFVINANPVEYGHIFIVPCNLHCAPNAVGKKSLELVTQISAEINNSSFHAFYDHLPSNSDIYFQACYFPNPLPVELMPVSSLFGEERSIQIFELADYPIKTVVFSGKKLKLLVDMVSEICAHLEKQSTPFNLLISDCGTKIFLFPQSVISSAKSSLFAKGCDEVSSLSTDNGHMHGLFFSVTQVQALNHRNLTAWESAGRFVFTEPLDFNNAVEEDVLKNMAMVSLDEEGFKEVKQLCCEVARKFTR